MTSSSISLTTCDSWSSSDEGQLQLAQRICRYQGDAPATWDSPWMRWSLTVVIGFSSWMSQQIGRTVSVTSVSHAKLLRLTAPRSSHRSSNCMRVENAQVQFSPYRLWIRTYAPVTAAATSQE